MGATEMMRFADHAHRYDQSDSFKCLDCGRQVDGKTRAKIGQLNMFGLQAQFTLNAIGNRRNRLNRLNAGETSGGTTHYYTDERRGNE